jgi:hypothetical protein
MQTIQFQSNLVQIYFHIDGDNSRPNSYINFFKMITTYQLGPTVP